MVMIIYNGNLVTIFNYMQTKIYTIRVIYF